MTSYETKSGKILTDADLDVLAEGAERGYDVSQVVDNSPCTAPVLPMRMPPRV